MGRMNKNIKFSSFDMFKPKELCYYKLACRNIVEIRDMVRK